MESKIPFALLFLCLLAFACGCSHNPTDAELAQVYRIGMTREDAMTTLSKPTQIETRPANGWPQQDNTPYRIGSFAAHFEQTHKTIVRTCDKRFAGLRRSEYREDYEAALYELCMRCAVEQCRILRDAVKDRRLWSSKPWRNPSDYGRCDLAWGQRLRTKLPPGRFGMKARTIATTSVRSHGSITTCC